MAGTGSKQRLEVTNCPTIFCVHCGARAVPDKRIFAYDIDNGRPWGYIICPNDRWYSFSPHYVGERIWEGKIIDV